jgi:hypothetical protein
MCFWIAMNLRFHMRAFVQASHPALILCIMS